MNKYLIVNADDYGLCKEISSGILKAYHEGIVTSTSVVSNGRFFQEGLALLKDSGIPTGIHLTFVGGEKPLIKPVEGLVDNQGYFHQDYSRVISNIITNHYDKDGLKKELLSQATKLFDEGLTISHIDAHQHLHLLPQIRPILFHIADRFNIKWIRVPQSHRWTIQAIGLNILGVWLKYQLRQKIYRHPDTCLGFDNSGCTNQNILSQTISRCRPGITEIILHPGFDASKYYNWNFQWSEELDAAVSPEIMALIHRNGIILTNYKDIK